MKIIIPGVPIPQARMRHFTFKGHTNTYDPNSKQKKQIRASLQAYNGIPEISYPRISFLFEMPIPCSFSKKIKALLETGRIKHDKKPDVDNLIKLYLDCLDGIILNGDQKVSLGPCIKVYSKEPKTTVWIQETTREIQPWEMILDASALEKPSFCEPDCPPYYESP